MSKPIKAIVCGAGDMARKHIEAYRKLDNVEIAAVASRSIPQEMIAAAEKHRRKLTVVFNRRFNTVWQELTQRLSSIGIPLVYNTQEIRSIRVKPAMHSQSANGGPVIDCCVHDLKENGHETIIRRFVESVELNSEVPVQPQEAIEALKISLAALKSIDSGKKETV